MEKKVLEFGGSREKIDLKAFDKIVDYLVLPDLNYYGNSALNLLMQVFLYSYTNAAKKDMNMKVNDDSDEKDR
jgi:hypothetical protein